MKVLSKCEWRKLHFLLLVNNEIDDFALDAIHCANWHLQFINLDKNFVFHVWNTITVFGVLTLSKSKLVGVCLYPSLKNEVPRIMRKIKIIESR